MSHCASGRFPLTPDGVFAGLYYNANLQDQGKPHLQTTGHRVEMVPVHVTERVCLTSEPLQKHCYKSCCEYEQGHRYIEDVRYVLGLSQVHYLTSYIHNPDTSRPEYHISAVRCEPRHKPRRWLSTVILYPKRPVWSYISTVEYSINRPTSRKRYMTKLDMAVGDGDEENNIVATNMLYFPKRRTPSFWSFFITEVNKEHVDKKFAELNNFKIKRDWQKQLSLQIMA
ncbi:refilin-B-like isoform X1 [Branchiostoma floridae x Branchiostoma japonicum]